MARWSIPRRSITNLVEYLAAELIATHFPERIMLGEPSWSPLAAEELIALVGDPAVVTNAEAR